MMSDFPAVLQPAVMQPCAGAGRQLSHLDCGPRTFVHECCLSTLHIKL